MNAIPTSEELLLAIESSCDETAGAIVRGGREVLASFVASQIDLHRRFGGVVPEVACRAHMEKLLPGIQSLFEKSRISPSLLDAIAVTHRPGLIGSLLVGVSAAKGLALAWQKPLIGVDHVEAHIASCRIQAPDLTFPFVALVVSGGHTNLYYIPVPERYERLGGTLDDAAGEAFDKVAKILGLGFPGGPIIEKVAQNGNPSAFPWKMSCLPPKHPFDFSFSGIKTAVLYAARGPCAGKNDPLRLDPQGVADAAASFQSAVVHALVSRTIEAAKKYSVHWIAVGGGVAANGAFRTAMEEAARAIGCRVAIPPKRLCTDNAEMVAMRAHELWQAGIRHPLTLSVSAR